ncbi:uncharacterized protein TRAVEDRAFT_57891 [Trametes versicolor FP-101664 SS1]|uniref:uncharacterized protein n=1 Tax=Trametes versicolor (strain FP-101664) TaxID=717944 RepID=UPI00046227D2|nr:uncharacterized protein TRAVEDRAFT_57891 [Trametes versicolor FP-101664 SS1]EIW60749.1 hypothetical protein TRAVEDRAFT_57891 [Trametes versicolor FP-101664 SS1]
MSGRCEECGATTEWDQELGSAICLQCGTLADPTQSVFTSHYDYIDTSAREYSVWSNVPGGGTLRGRNGWALAGQGKEARDRKNTISMHEFIRTIATRQSNPGITSRAQGIFDQAMRRGHYRWGRRAKLTAGAALAIALREAHKSDSIRDIAYLLDESPNAVSRAFSAVVELLDLKLSTADPAVHLPMLQTHLVSLVDITQGNTSSNPLPAQLIKTLSSLLSQLTSVMRIANALSVLLERTHMLAHLPTQPTACAILLLALEAELGSSLPHAGALAQSLGARVGAGKGVVMQRYKQIYDLVEEWIREVPWLDAHERKRAKGKAGGGRSKVAKRVVVARGLKDVVQFQEEIWRKRVESAGRPLLELEVDEKDTGTDDWDGSQISSTASQAPSGSGSSHDGTGPRKGKKAKTHHPKSIVDASHFLLDPLSTSALPSPAPLGSALTRCASPRTAGPGSPDLLTHLLTADASSLSHVFRAAPSRLQLLAADRGGADESCIADDELFGEDELEGFMRAPEEVEAVRIAMGWDEDGDADGGEGSAKETKRGKKRRRDDVNEGDEAGQVSTTGKGKERAVGSKRINMDALARLLDPEAHPVAEQPELENEYGGTHGVGVFDEDEVDHEDKDFEEDEDGSVGTVVGRDDPFTARSAPDDGGEVVEEWRPLSPGGGGSAEDWYDF